MMDAIQKALRVAKADGGGNVQGAPDAGVPAAGPDYSGFVSNLYQTELGRAPEAAGLQGWVNALQSGQMTQDQVRQGILSSSENQVQDLYGSLLNRGMDPDAYNWVNALESGQMTPAQVRAGITSSAEYQKLNPTTATARPTTQTPTVKTPTTPMGNTTTTNPVDITNQGMPLIYTPPPYKDYGATAAAFRVASGLENLPAPFYTLSPVSGGTSTESGSQPNGAITGGGTTTNGAPAGGTNANTTYQQILNQIGQRTPIVTPKPPVVTPKTPTPQTSVPTSRVSDIANLYQQFLGRGAEAGAAEKWADAIGKGQLTYNEVLNQIKTSPEAQVYADYQNILGRRPDAGAQGWVNAIISGQMTPEQVRQAIQSSPEAQGLGAATAPAAGVSPAGVAPAPAPAPAPVTNAVASAYQQYLGRDPEPGAAEAWAGAIASGAMTPDQVIAAIASSPEAQSFYTPDYGRKDGGAVKGYADGGGTNYEDLVKAAYQDFLGRSPDDAGYQSWLNALTSGDIAPSDFESRFKGAGYEDDIVGAYQSALNRSPTSDEVNAWNNALVKGDMTIDQVMQKINRSPEATSMPAYRNVPEPDKFSERQGGRMYDIDIGRVERIPELGRMAAPVNVKQAFENSEIERLKRELEAAKTAGTAQSRDLGGGGNSSDGGGSNFGGSDASGTAGGVNGSDYGGGSGDNPGSEGGSPATLARGGMAGNNAVDNALRMLKADRH